MPVLEPFINIRLMDEDNVKDEMAGTIRLKTQDLIEKEYMNGQFTWKNFYGSPLGQSNSDEKDEMNKDPSIATAWKGRILIQTVIEKCEKPEHRI